MPEESIEERHVLRGVDPDALAFARQQLSNGTVWGLAVSGKLASGKDTVATLVMDELGADRREHLSWATPLKDGLDELLDEMRRAASPEEAVERIADHDIGIIHAQRLVYEMWSEAQEGVKARSRTPRVRWALQYFGTDVRRAEDPDYWVRRAVQNCVAAICEGRSVYFTDCRFPNEVEAAAMLGLYTVRLEITPEMQEARLRGRDGLGFDPSAASHPSETALDAYKHFDLIVDNNGLPIEAVCVITAGVRSRRHRL